MTSSVEERAKLAEQRFSEIVSEEIKIIMRRRRALGRPLLVVPSAAETEAAAADDGAPTPSDEKEKDRASRPLDVTGLALSGGGIRSASFCLGVLQSLHEYKCLDRIDYLSTVSGGGYMGTAMTAMTTKLNGEFRFGESTGRRAGGTRPADVKDTPAIGHLRNYSNYLIPFGGRDVITALAIVLRGLIANGATVLAVVLLMASVTVLCNPRRSELFVANVFGLEIAPLLGMEWLNSTRFGLTLLLSLVGVGLFLFWGVWRSWQSEKAKDDQSEFRTVLPTIFSYYLVLLGGFFLFELQPVVIEGMFDLVDQARAKGSSDYSLITLIFQWLAAIATPLAAAVTVFRRQVETLLNSVTASSAISTKALALAANAAVWIGGAAVPLLIWVGYLHLCYWGIVNDHEPDVSKTASPPAIQATIEVKGPGVNLRSVVGCTPSAENSCGTKVAEDAPGPTDHTPAWLHLTAGLVATVLPANPARSLEERQVVLVYVIFGALLFLVSTQLTPNANSLHRLYRDRLSKAFLFDPTKDEEKKSVASGGRDFDPLNMMKLSQLVPDDPSRYVAPYHLINAALNVQGSDFANRRGRNADFFLFSPRYVGSEVTGYAPTVALEEKAGLDLATAMAISGAAFSPNAGAASIRALTPTLALLNIRTGYWLPNPKFIEPTDAEHAAPAGKPRHVFWNYFYLLSEILGMLYEDSKDVFISDGGHIENLGVYQLLRRRCRVIVVVDAEADPAMRFPSFIALQRYARIDLGVRINMPWNNIHKATTNWMGFAEKLKPAAADKKAEERANKRTFGPHVAIGTIDYDGGEKGWLVYVKASLTGDENDYVRDYGRRYNQFPHESTGDQFFSEEQFEVYRALGFHIMSRFLNETDTFQVFDDGKGSVDRKINSRHDNVKPVREALLG